MSFECMPPNSLMAQKQRGEIARLVIERIDTSLPMPTYAHEGDSGFDLYAYGIPWTSPEDLVTEFVNRIDPGETLKIHTGYRAVIPEGFEIQIRPRGGKTEEGLVAQFGTVDTGYRGWWWVNLLNTSQKPKTVSSLDRIAQAVLAPVTRAHIVEGVVACDTDRGKNGLGSTGK